VSRNLPKMAFLGETFVKAGGSSVDLAYVTQAKIIIVMYTAGVPISDAHVARYSQLMVLNYSPEIASLLQQTTHSFATPTHPSLPLFFFILARIFCTVRSTRPAYVGGYSYLSDW
jgi:hypothetical protein